MDTPVDPQSGLNSPELGAPLSPEPKHGVIFESIQIGGSVKVTAIDVASGVEVSVVGPSQALARDLQTLALAKLRRRLTRKPDKP